jgi:hypothetical protein
VPSSSRKQNPGDHVNFLHVPVPLKASHAKANFAHWYTIRQNRREIPPQLVKGKRKRNYILPLRSTLTVQNKK